MKLLEQIHDWAGEKVNGTSFNIDLVNACGLHCPSCAVGAIATKRKGIMSIDLFRRILDKAQREGKVRHCQLYIYSDPAMHKDLHLFVQECTKRGIPSWISTVLQVTNCDFEKVIEARPSEFRISFAGWNKMSYFQAGGIPEVFDRKFAQVCALPRYKETVWTMAFHCYNDNQDERPRAETLAKNNKLKFVPLPSIWMPLEVYVEGNYTTKDKELISHLIATPEEAVKNMKQTSTCGLWRQISIDANGDTFLCQLLYKEEFKLVPFLDYPRKEIKKMIMTHSFCGKCLAKKGNQYQSCYAEFVSSKDPIGEANKKRMKK